jgi:hypothetical protein
LLVEPLAFRTSSVATVALRRDASASCFAAVQTGLLSGRSQRSANTAIGVNALGSDETGGNNTASGYYALNGNLSGSNNTASGYQSMASNLYGGYNTAAGYNSLYSNTSGSNNTAAGDAALYSNTTANNNTASGTNALHANKTGNSNSAFGFDALTRNVSGVNNAAIGQNALYYSTGSRNIGVGADAGYNLTSGSNNIDIGNQGIAGESGVIRIGAPSTQNKTYIAGIENTKVTGAAVYVTTSGQLGVLASSERYKTAIAPMGTNTNKLRQLRPVSFHLKTDPNDTVQYGLIAEEVNQVYPELVIRDESGKIQRALHHWSYGTQGALRCRSAGPRLRRIYAAHLRLPRGTRTENDLRAHQGRKSCGQAQRPEVWAGASLKGRATARRCIGHGGLPEGCR